jgi:hypothetical protein
VYQPDLLLDLSKDEIGVQTKHTEIGCSKSSDGIYTIPPYNEQYYDAVSSSIMTTLALYILKITVNRHLYTNSATENISNCLFFYKAFIAFTIVRL